MAMLKPERIKNPATEKIPKRLNMEDASKGWCNQMLKW
jgi:hypothetical protein